jgi:hypothetical protein
MLDLAGLQDELELISRRHWTGAPSDRS